MKKLLTTKEFCDSNYVWGIKDPICAKLPTERQLSIIKEGQHVRLAIQNEDKITLLVVRVAKVNPDKTYKGEQNFYIEKENKWKHATIDFKPENILDTTPVRSRAKGVL